MKKFFIIFALISLVLNPLTGQNRGITTVKTVLNKMENSLKQITDLKANYTLINGQYKSNGVFYYKKPYFFRLNSFTDGSQIVSNGKKLWIHVPYYGIVAEQELIKSEQQAKILLISSKKSLRHLKKDYSFRFAPGGKTNKKYYILDLYPRITKIGFKFIRLWINKNTGLITKVNSRTINNRIVNIVFSQMQINLKKTLPNGLFWFGMPDSNVQVIKNTILPVDIFKKRR